MPFLEGGMEAVATPCSFDPGPVARTAGPLTRLRRSFSWPQAAVDHGYGFDPGLSVQLPGPWTRLRRTGTELVPELPPVPRAAPVAAALVGTVAVAGFMAKSRPASSASEVSPIERVAVAPAPRAEAVPTVQPAPPLGQVEAKLVGGRAVLPDDAPNDLKQVVAAANRIQGRPYVYGGGHGSFESAGYDCSGAVSYALHGASLLDSPLASGALAGWGAPGEGKAITVYAHGGHTYAVIAGLRWDTSGTGSSGPSWHADMRSPAGYVARHPRGL